MRIWVWITYGLLIAVTLDAQASDNNSLSTENPPNSFAYNVFVDELNLYAEPSINAPILKVLEKWTRLKYAGSDFAPTLDHKSLPFWVKVNADGVEGWVIIDSHRPTVVYDEFRQADELGKAGDSEGMVAAVKAAGARYEGEKLVYNISPDGRKIVMAAQGTDWGWTETDAVPSGFPMGEVFYFVAGRGLVDTDEPYAPVNGVWSSDSRFFLYDQTAVEEWNWKGEIILLDVETWERKTLGLFCPPVDEPRFEFAGQYAVWMSYESFTGKIPSFPTDKLYVPALLAYDTAKGKTYRCLEPDMKTLRQKDTNNRRTVEYQLKLVPASDCPDGVKLAKVFRSYKGRLTWVLVDGCLVEYFWSSPRWLR